MHNLGLFTNDSFWSLNEYGFYTVRYVTRGLILHEHTFKELFLVCSGTINHIISTHQGESRSVLKKGDIFVLKQNIAHGFENDTEAEIINILYNDKFLSIVSKELRLVNGFEPLFIYEPEQCVPNQYPYTLHLDDSDLMFVANLLGLIAYLLEKHDCNNILTLKMMLLSVISFLSGKYNENSPNSYKFEILAKATDYMNEKIGERLTIPDIAHYCGVSRKQLSRYFNTYYNVSPHEYYNNLKLNTAFNLICKHGAQIQMAAQQVGFDDFSYFSRVFKERFGYPASMLAKHIKF